MHPVCFIAFDSSHYLLGKCTKRALAFLLWGLGELLVPRWMIQLQTFAGCISLSDVMMNDQEPRRWFPCLSPAHDPASTGRKEAPYGPLHQPSKDHLCPAWEAQTVRTVSGICLVPVCPAGPAITSGPQSIPGRSRLQDLPLRTVII